MQQHGPLPTTSRVHYSWTDYADLWQQYLSDRAVADREQPMSRTQTLPLLDGWRVWAEESDVKATLSDALYHATAGPISSYTAITSHAHGVGAWGPFQAVSQVPVIQCQRLHHDGSHREWHHGIMAVYKHTVPTAMHDPESAHCKFVADVRRKECTEGSAYTRGISVLSDCPVVSRHLREGSRDFWPVRKLIPTKPLLVPHVTVRGEESGDRWLVLHRNFHFIDHMKYW